MDSLVRDCDKLAKHQSSALGKTLGAVETMIRTLETQRDAEAGTIQCKHLQETVSEQLKELNSNIAKYGKHVERAFKLDLGVVAESRAFENKQTELGHAVLLHFLRTGEFTLARLFAAEANVELPGDVWTQFEAMNVMVRQIREKQLEPSLDWCVANSRRDSLQGLEFTLRRLRFLQLVEENSGGAALEYARKWFPQLSSTSERMDEIAQLMGVLMYAKRVATSPYADEFRGDRWDEGASEFASAFCAVSGVAGESPLAVSVDAGAQALAVVSKVSGLLRDRRVEWSQQDELAVEVPLPDHMRFHSVFACPVSKEQASQDNPPMALPCGHVVCKASLDKLARGTRPGAVASGRFKCPYCPGMATAGDAERVHF
ncbi:hypothetical protein GGI20_004192 [Coemansia sp. BCRC 34301]|nr:hypothetical protein GGI20_004192 [Coemansia sp. BCRC 34301]